MKKKKVRKVLFLRRGYGISQEEIAQRLATSRKTVREKELGLKDYTETEMLELTRIFNEYDPSLTLNEIFFAN